MICLHIVCHSYFFKCNVKQDGLILNVLQDFISFLKIMKLKIFESLILVIFLGMNETDTLK